MLNDKVGVNVLVKDLDEQKGREGLCLMLHRGVTFQCAHFLPAGGMVPLTTHSSSSPYTSDQRDS